MSLLFQILANKESKRICFNINFGLTEYNFLLTKCLSLHYPKKNMMKQQETVKKEVLLQLQKNYLKRIIFWMVITFVFTMHEGTICENLSLFLYLYADFFIE